jgi:hypothetical protein
MIGGKLTTHTTIFILCNSTCWIIWGFSSLHTHILYTLAEENQASTLTNSSCGSTTPSYSLQQLSNKSEFLLLYLVIYSWTVILWLWMQVQA